MNVATETLGPDNTMYLHQPTIQKSWKQKVQGSSQGEPFVSCQPCANKPPKTRFTGRESRKLANESSIKISEAQTQSDKLLIG